MVISSFNAARFLPAALDSVLGQSMADLEVVLVDDASTDDTAAVLGRYTDARLQVLRNEQNLGPFASANRALQKASGTFIARLDADDVCFPHRLAVQLEVFDALKSRGALFARVGGDVAFYVKGAKPPMWQVSNLGGRVVVKPGTPPFPVCTIGLSPPVLSWLVQGTLDVERNFRQKRLAVEGDLEALKVFVSCFAPLEADGS